MKCLWVVGEGMVSLVFYLSVDGKVNGRISKFLGVVRDGNEYDGGYGIS